MEVLYKPTFVRTIKKLPKRLQSEVFEKIKLFESEPNSPALKIHILHEKFKGLYAFSVSYEYRIIFEYSGKNKIILLDFGDHDIYK